MIDTRHYICVQTPRVTPNVDCGLCGMMACRCRSISCSGCLILGGGRCRYVALLLWEWGIGREGHGLGPGGAETRSGRSGRDRWVVCTRRGQEREAAVGYDRNSSRVPSPTLPRLSPPSLPPSLLGNRRWAVCRLETHILRQMLSLFGSRLWARLDLLVCFPVAQTLAGHMARQGQAWNEGPVVGPPHGVQDFRLPRLANSHLGWFAHSWSLGAGEGGDPSRWLFSRLVWTPTIWLNFLF